MIEDLKWVTATVAFVVPGMLMSQIIGLFIPRKKTDEKVALLRYFFLTCLSFGAFIALPKHTNCFPLLTNAPTIVVGSRPETLTNEGYLCYFLLLPILLGFIFGLASQQNWVGQSLARFGFRSIHAMPTAWDYKFSKTDACYMIVTLKDSTIFYGQYASDSFSGDSDSMDIYMEKIYIVKDDGDWEEIQQSGGVWIKADQISTVEFR